MPNGEKKPKALSISNNQQPEIFWNDGILECWNDGVENWDNEVLGY
jgi:hypothetical protein